jgi:hypothetical protein
MADGVDGRALWQGCGVILSDTHGITRCLQRRKRQPTGFRACIALNVLSLKHFG